MNRFKCPHCMQEVQVEDNMAGQTMTCPHCSKQFAVPALNGIPMAQVNGLPAQPSRPENLGMATTSMVLGIFSFIGVPFCGLAALITGIISISKINNMNGLLLGKGKAITGIVFGCWSILRLAIMAALLLPYLAHARDNARQILCVSNLKQIGLIAMMYSQDNHDYLPASMEDLQSYMEGITIECPCYDKSKDDAAYVLLPLEERNIQKITRPVDTPIVICTKHKRVDIVAYVDGHVEVTPKKNISRP